MSSITSSALPASASWTTRPSRRTRSRSAYDGRLGIVGDHHHGLPELVDGAPQEPAAPPRSISSRGCRWARRRTPRPASRPGRGPPRRAAAGRRRARTGGGCAGRRGRRCRSAARSTAASGFSPAIESGSTTFSSAVRTGSRLKNWKMKPSLSRRSRVRSASSSAVISTPSSDTDPEVGPVETGEDVHEGRLARARRSHDGAEAASLEADRHAGERVHGGVALSVAAADVGGADDRIHASQGGKRTACLQYG